MNFDNYEKNVLLVALDHMEEHLEAIEQYGIITEYTYKLRMEAVSNTRNKIENN